MDIISRLFDTDDFPARWECGNWSSALGWLHIVSDILIFVAYTAIPVSLLFIMIRRRDIPFPLIIALFSAFILFCGVGHLLEAVIFYEPIYRFAGVWKAGTAIVSLVTAFVLIRAMPNVLSIPSVHRANVELTGSLDRERQHIEELTRDRSALESHTAKLTSRSRKMTEAALAARVVACAWTLPDGEIEWEVGYDEAARSAKYHGASTLSNWSDLLEPGVLRDALAAWARGAEEDASVDLELPLRGHEGGRVRVSARPEPRVNGQTRSMVGMFRFVDGSAPGPDQSSGVGP